MILKYDRPEEELAVDTLVKVSKHLYRLEAVYHRTSEQLVATLLMGGAVGQTVEDAASVLKVDRRTIMRRTAEYRLPPPSRLMTLGAIVVIAEGYRRTPNGTSWAEYLEGIHCDPSNLSKIYKELLGTRPGRVGKADTETLVTLFYMKHWPKKT